jgi:hypothetical protein
MLEKTLQNLGLLIGIFVISRYFSEKLFFSDSAACAREIEFAATGRTDREPRKTSVSKKEMSM